MSHIIDIFKIIFLGNYQFFLEMMCAFLIVSINFKKRKYFWLAFPVFIAIGFPFYYLPPIHFLGFTFSYIIVFLAIIVLGFGLYQERADLIILNAAIAFGLQHFTWNSMFVFLEMIPGIGELDAMWLRLIYLNYYIVIYLCVFLLLYKSQLRLFKTKYFGFIYIVGALILLVTFILSQKIDRWTIYIRGYTALTSALCVVLMYVYPHAVKYVTKQKDLEKEKETLERLISMQAHENEMYRENREIVNIKLHDLKHQLDVLASLDSREDIVQHIEEIKKNTQVYDSFAKTGNDIVDIILTQKSLSCMSKKIRFTYIVDGEALKMFTNNDIASLLGNILDNAIEAAEKEEGDYRLIKVNIYSSNDILVISQSNYTKNNPIMMDGLPKSSKAGQLHGYGLKSIKYICQKYNGEMNIKFENDTFQLDLLFPLK